MCEENLELDCEVSLDEEEIDHYCRRFADIMLAELHKKYELRSRKRSKTQDQNEEKPKQLVQKNDDKGNKPI